MSAMEHIPELQHLLQLAVAQIVANPDWSTFVAFCAVIFNAGFQWAGFRTLRKEAATKKDLRNARLALMLELQQWTADNYPSRRECSMLHEDREARGAGSD